MVINLNGSDEYKMCTIGNNNGDVIQNHNNQHANFLKTTLEGGVLVVVKGGAKALYICLEC